MEIFSQYGITQTDLVNIVAVVVLLLLVLGVLRAIFRLTKSLMRMGCAVILLIAGALLLLSYLNPV